MAKVTRGYEEMVASMDSSAAFLDRARAARGPSAKQIAEHQRDLAETRARRGKN